MNRSEDFNWLVNHIRLIKNVPGSLQGLINLIGKTHGLIQQVRLASVNDADNPIIEDGTPIYETARRTGWKHDLIRLLAKTYGCAVLVRSRQEDIVDTTKRRHNSVLYYYLYGKTYSIYIVRTLFEWLSISIHESCQKDVHGRGREAMNVYYMEAIRSLTLILQHEESKLGFQQIFEDENQAVLNFLRRKNKLSRPLFPSVMFSI